ncbi:MAG TPA: PEGA domain-containing protein [Opitutaceae bacterium]|jgi:dipeptidyl aminopeptidase/acylaminoacyl peptidase
MKASLTPRWRLSTALAALIFLMSACSSTIPLSSDPPGATVSVNGLTMGTTPVEVPWNKGQDNLVHFEHPGYFPEELNIPSGVDQHDVTVQLAPTTRTRSFDLVTDPPGATITIDGQNRGVTPERIDVTFDRPRRDVAWDDRKLTLFLPGHQTESFRLPADQGAIGTIKLALLRDERLYHVDAITKNGETLHADVTLDGKVIGTTPLDLPVVFERSNKFAAWPVFQLSVGIAGQYKAESSALDFDGGTNLQLTLAPLSEITTTMVAPGPVMTANGISWEMIERKSIAMLNARETSDAIEDLKPVTQFSRQDLRGSTYTRVEAINSFAVSPDGQNVIFSLTCRDAAGHRYCNLYVKRADGAAGGIAELTTGTRNVDTGPRIANDGSNYLVFTSNRGERLKPDIFRSNFIDNSLSGGISRLTSDSRYNFEPTYGEANRQVFYLSIEPNFPLAETQVSSIRINGSLPTQLSISAQEIDNSIPDKVYFVKIDEDTKKQQIYSIQADGKLETAIISEESFRGSNCFDPAPSPDGGSRIAFVSDFGVDDQLRHNNDLYVMSMDGTGLERLTQNGSDDIKPMWSPSEDGVIFFLSNRGGAYNVWRMKLRSGGRSAAKK